MNDLPTPPVSPLRVQILLAIAGFCGWTFWCVMIALFISTTGEAYAHKREALGLMSRIVPLALVIGWLPATGAIITRDRSLAMLPARFELTLAQSANAGAVFAGLAGLILLLSA